MSADWPLYAIATAAVLLGGILTLKKWKNEEMRVMGPWILWSLGISAAIFVILVLQSLPTSNVWSGPLTRQDLTGPLFAYAILFAGTLVLSGAILGTGRLCIIAYRARKDLR